MAREEIESPSEDQMIIRLLERPDSGLWVSSVNLLVGGMHTCLDGQDGNTLEAVFKPAMAAQIREICQNAAQPGQIIDVPEYRQRIRGLSIAGYTLMVSTLDDGARRLVLRLRHVVGDALEVFHPLGTPGSELTLFTDEATSPAPRGAGSDRLFDEMLSQLYLPLANLNSYLEAVLDGQRKPCPERMTASVLQVKTKAEVLKFAFDRLISEAVPDQGGGHGPKRPRNADRATH